MIIVKYYQLLLINIDCYYIIMEHGWLLSFIIYFYRLLQIIIDPSFNTPGGWLSPTIL